MSGGDLHHGLRRHDALPRIRRIVRKDDRLVVENRAGSANLAETAAFMDDKKRIL
jgi:hypothetical protein